MDYESLRQAADSSEGVYNTVTVIAALGGIAAGYALSSLLGGRRSRIAEANARQAEAECRIEELKDAEGAHQRKLSLMDKERDIKIADEERKEQRKQKEYEAQSQRDKERREGKIAVAKELASSPELKAYLERLTAAEQSDATMEAEKAEFKKKTYQKVLDRIDEDEEDNGGVAGRIYREETVISDDDEAAVEHLAELLYPPSSRKSATERMQPHLKGLIRIVLEDDTSMEETTEEED